MAQACNPSTREAEVGNTQEAEVGNARVQRQHTLPRAAPHPQLLEVLSKEIKQLRKALKGQ